MDGTNLTNFFIEQGLPGVLILVLGWAYWQKDKQLFQVFKDQMETNKALEATMRELTRLVEGRQ